MSPYNIYLNNKIVGAIVNFSDKYFNVSIDSKFAYAFLMLCSCSCLMRNWYPLL